MIQAMRGAIGSWVIKILFALLIISFGAWGITDFFTAPGDDPVVAAVGPVEITNVDLQRALNNQRQALRDQMQNRVTPEFERHYSRGLRFGA